MPRTPALLMIALIAPLLAACGNMGDRRQPIPQADFVDASRPADALVVVLPGRWDNVGKMADFGIAQAIREAWPEADVRLAGATLAYYLDGGLPERLHTEVIAPAREAGYREIWLVGASMGGMGSLLYDRQYPGQVDGIVLLAPFLGDRGLLREIGQAGGPLSWDPGEPPAEVNRGNYQREIWRHLRTQGQAPGGATRLWLAYGDEDRLRQAVPVIAPLMPESHILERPGGHVWAVWVPAAAEVFTRIRERQSLARTEAPL